MQQGYYPKLSVVMIVGTNRTNAQGGGDALDRQRCSDDFLEIVVLDCADTSVPVPFFVYCLTALGEAAGYLFGLPDAGAKFVKWELNIPRIACARL